MKLATMENMTIEPGYFHRNWQSCNWFFEGVKAFHHRIYTPWMKPMTDSFWLDGWQTTTERLKGAITTAGLDPDKYDAMEEPYGEGFFPIAHTAQDAIDYFNASRKAAKGDFHELDAQGNPKAGKDIELFF